jgi:predicted MFS family arabinose efflux permease
VSRALRASLSSLAVANFRRYFAGQAISLAGTWMQTVAETWLVLRLTGSGVALGISTALQFAPVLVAGAWGGLLADRIDKRRLLTITQTLMALPALTLWVLTAFGHVELWQVFALIFARGAVNAVDNPARQSFVMEMVGRDRVVNAVSVNSVLVQTARIAGPALAALVIATVGVATCFLLNALSFGAMLTALRRMDPGQLHRGPVSPRGRGQLREALRVVATTPALRTPLLLMAVVGTLSFNFTVVLPLLARFTLHGDASTYALLTSVMGAGAIVGALRNGARARVSPAVLGGAAMSFGAGLAAAAIAPSLVTVLIALLVVGASSVTFAASVNASLQLAAAPELRGRVMALYAVVFLGSTPIGGPLVGWLSEAEGPRAGLAVGALAALGAGLWVAARGARRPAPAGATATSGA